MLAYHTYLAFFFLLAVLAFSTTVNMYLSYSFKWLQSINVCSVAQLCLTLCDLMGCSPPGSSVHGILQARILELVASPFSKGSSRTRDQTSVSFIAGRFFTSESLEKHQEYLQVIWNQFFIGKHLDCFQYFLITDNAAYKISHAYK